MNFGNWKNNKFKHKGHNGHEGKTMKELILFPPFVYFVVKGFYYANFK